MTKIDRQTKSLESELYAADFIGSGDEELRILRGMLLAVRRNFWIVGLLALLAGAAAFLAASMIQDRFTAAARVKLNTRVSTDVQFTPDGSDLPITISSLESELEVLRSSDLIEASILELELITPLEEGADEETQLAFQDEFEELIESIADARTVEQVGTVSAVFEITVTHPDPYLAAALANSLSRLYLERQTDEKVRSLERAQGWLTERTAKIQADITDLVKQQETHEIESPLSPEESATIKAQRQIGERRLSAKQQDVADLENRIARIAAFVTAGDYQGAADLLPLQNAQLAEALTLVETDASDDVVALIGAEIDAGVIAMQNELLTLRENIQISERDLAALRAQQEQQAIHDGQARQIESEIAVTQAIYQDFVSELSRRTEQTDFLDSDGRIIEFARAPRNPSEPNERMLALAAFMAVMFFGLLAAMLSEIGRRTMRTTREFEEVCGAELRSVLPDLGRNKNIIAELLDGAGSPQFPALSTFARKLRVSVLAAEKHQPSSVAAKDGVKSENIFKAQPVNAKGKAAKSGKRAKIVAGASSVSGEGQSTALLVTARAFAEAGERVLLVDGDFWNSPYDFDDEVDHSNLSVRWGNKGQLCASGVPGLDILPARLDLSSPDALSNILGFFSSKECDAVFDDLAGRYDRIFIDAPPLLEVVDSVSLLSRADQVIFFSRWKSTKTTMAENAIRMLDDVEIRPSFCVATRVRLREVGRYGDTSLSHLNQSVVPITN